MDEGEENFDDYLNQLDADIAKEKVDLPSAPVEVSNTSSMSKAKSAETSQKRSAVLESIVC